MLSNTCVCIYRGYSFWGVILQGGGIQGRYISVMMMRSNHTRSGCRKNEVMQYNETNQNIEFLSSFDPTLRKEGELT